MTPNELSAPRRRPTVAARWVLAAGLALLGGAAALIVWRAMGERGFDRGVFPPLETGPEVVEAARKPRRLLVLGDSFLSWWPVEDSLWEALRRFSAAADVGLVNAAAAGFGPFEYEDQMRHLGPALRPQLVLLFYYAGNDLTDVQYRPDERPRRPTGGPTGAREPGRRGARLRPGPAGSGRPGLPAILPTAAARSTDPSDDQFDWEAMRRYGIAADLIAKAQNRLRHPNAIGPDYVNPYLLDLALSRPRYLLDNLLIEGPENEAAWRKVERALGHVASVAEGLGAELCIVVIASTVQVDRSHFEFYRRARFEVEDRLANATGPQDRLRAFCEARGLSLVDLLPAFKSHPLTEGLYWENDDHFSEAGHRLAWSVLLREFLSDWEARTGPP